MEKATLVGAHMCPNCAAIVPAQLVWGDPTAECSECGDAHTLEAPECPCCGAGADQTPVGTTENNFCGHCSAIY